MNKRPWSLHTCTLFLTVMALVLILSTLNVHSATFTDKPFLIVGIDADYAPLEYIDEDGDPHGYDVDFTNRLMERMNIKFTYAPNTWENISGDVLHGRVDLGMMIYSDYRKDSTNYSRAVFRLYYQVVYRKQDGKSFNFRNLHNKRIAYMKSRPVGRMLAEEKAIGAQVTNLRQAFLDLKDGKYDAVICFRYQARYFISRLNLTSLRAEDLSLQPREYCYVSHNKQLIDAINTELLKMEEEGIIDEVYGKDIKSQFDTIVIPQWVWWLLVSLIVVFLLVLVVVTRHSRSKLAAEHMKVLNAIQLLEEKNSALVKANERAEESARMKTAFIQQISHEIRTPLNVLNGFTQVLTTTGMELSSEEKADICQRIESNTERITELINKMLELSEANSQTIIEKDEQTEARQIAQLAISNSGIEQAPHISFTLHVGNADKELAMRTNVQQAARALTLLLDNAKKFTTEGEVLLSVQKSSDPAFISFTVQDSGKGIPANEAEHIFEAFVQLDEYYDGTGIGLTVARSIARRLNGDIVLDTTYNGPGSRFVMTLPA